MTDRELMQQALEALELYADYEGTTPSADKAITALRERLAQPEQKPVAWFDKEFNSVRWRANLRNCDLADQQPLYTTPPRREWQGLTDEDCVDAIDEYFDFALDNGNVSNASVIRYARVIEAKLKEKNA